MRSENHKELNLATHGRGTVFEGHGFVGVHDPRSGNAYIRELATGLTAGHCAPTAVLSD